MKFLHKKRQTYYYKRKIVWNHWLSAFKNVSFLLFPLWDWTPCMCSLFWIANTWFYRLVGRSVVSAFSGFWAFGAFTRFLVACSRILFVRLSAHLLDSWPIHHRQTDGWTRRRIDKPFYTVACAQLRITWKSKKQQGKIMVLRYKSWLKRLFVRIHAY